MDFSGILSVNERRNIRVFVRMKTSFALGCGLLLVMSTPDLLGQQSARSFVREMSVDVAIQDRFFAKYPDLADERDVVAAAGRQLAAQGVGQTNAEEALAEQARAILAQRTPQEWQRKAVSIFPELGVAGSEFNALFLRHHAELQRTSPQYLQEPSWPVLLARRCADELRVLAPTGVADTAPRGKSSGVRAEVAGATKPAGRLGFWPLLLSVTLLLAIIVQPGLWLLRCSRAFAGVDGPVTLWQRALRPAAWSYLAVALLALVRTFQANADQVFIDRFGITLIVSVLAGLVITPLAFAMALGATWWLRRAASRAEAVGPALAPPAPPRPRAPAAK